MTTPRITWVLGPPCAGKTTWALEEAPKVGARVLEMASLLEWLDGADQGVHQAKLHLVAAIRAVELHRDGRPLFVVAARLDPLAMPPFSASEHVVVVLPLFHEWQRRTTVRGALGDRGEYDVWLSRLQQLTATAATLVRT